MEEKRILVINKYEYGLIINALNEYRTQLIKMGKSTDFVNEVLLKLIDTPIKRNSIYKREKVGFER